MWFWVIVVFVVMFVGQVSVYEFIGLVCVDVDVSQMWDV